MLWVQACLLLQPSLPNRTLEAAQAGVLPEADPPKVEAVVSFLPGDVLDFKSQGLWYGGLRALIGTDDEALGEQALDRALEEAAKRSKTTLLSAQLEQVSLNRKIRNALKSKRTSSEEATFLQSLRHEVLNQDSNVVAVRVSFQGESNEMLVVRSTEGNKFAKWSLSRESEFASVYALSSYSVGCEEGALAILPIGLARRFFVRSKSIESLITTYPLKLSAEASGSSCAFFSRRSMNNLLHICDVKPNNLPLRTKAGQFMREAELSIQPRTLPESDHDCGICFNCGDAAHFRCTGCNYVKLCSEECRELYWEFGHRDTCALKSKKVISRSLDNGNFGSFVLMEADGDNDDDSGDNGRN